MGNAQLKEFDDGDGEDFVDELKPGTKLMHGQYEIVSFLNAGGFGITYLAKDSLDRKIVIKECFPGAFCRRSRTIVQARSRAHQTELKSIVRLFIQEARSLAKMDHPNIVGVHQVFEDNDTAYMALDFVEGRDLLDTLEDPNHGLSPEQIKKILTEVLGAVGFIHDQEILHRDISPDNILIDAKMHPVLIDFGAAREQATKQSRVLSALRVVKDGYSPQEFYIAGSEQNASSDLYALGASFYHLIANEVPPNSQARLAAIAQGEADPYVPLIDKAKGYDKNFLAALDMSLAVLPKDRVQSAQDWLDMMEGKSVKKAAPVAVAATGGDAQKPKSKMPMLMASVAVVALLGVGVLTQTDILSPAGEPAAAVEQEVVAVVEPVVEEPTAATETEEPVVAVTEEPVSVAEEPTVVPVEVPSIVETATVDTGIRPEARPEDLAIAEPVVAEPVVTEPVVEAVAEPALPEPLVTPEMIKDSAETPALPGFLANAPVATDNPTPTLALPDSPVDVAAAETVLDVEIAALVPGNEIVPEPVAEEPVVEAPVLVEAATEPSFILSAWSVDLPFEPLATAPDTIGEAAFIAPLWVNEGVVVKSVNGFPVDGIGEIPKTLRDNVDPGESAQVTVSFGIENNGVSETHDWPMTIRQDYQLLNGVSFSTLPTDDGWTTVVTALPESVETELQVGDELIAYIPTSTPINTRTALKDVFESEVAAGAAQFTFAVNRNNSMWVAGLDYNANPQND